MSTLRARQHGDWRVRAYRNPVRLAFSASPWRAIAYLVSYLVVSGVLFAVALSAGLVALILSITIVAIPLLIAAAWVIRGCASAERWRLRLVVTDPVRGGYLPPSEDGLWHAARSRWTASATWRDLGYVVGLWPAMFVLDAVVVAIWATLLAGITLPAWYSHISDACVGGCTAHNVPGLMIGHYPHGPHGPGGWGLYVDSLAAALLVAAGSAVLWLLFNYVLVGTARLHGQVARAVLRHPIDPLAPAKNVLAGPGPLGPLTAADR